MQVQEKIIPPSTADVIFPPNKDHEYFQQWQEHPFRPLATSFEPVNAWWLAEAALLAYADEAFIRQLFGNPRLQPAGVALEFFSGESTQCFVAHTPSFVLVSFRGTEVRAREGVQGIRHIVADVVADLKCILVESGQGGKVHKGFKDALDEVWETRASAAGQTGLRACLERLRTQGGSQRPFSFTGHSLGAALATLAADRYGNVQGLYTFGSPRVGDDAFRTDFHVNTHRFVNNNDIVGRIPSPSLYHHIGMVKYIDSTGALHDNPSFWERLKDSFRGAFGHIFTSLGHIRAGFVDTIPLDHLTDHTPLYYALHCWNNYVRNRQ